MKKFIFFMFIASSVQAKTITLNIPDKDIAVVENDVIDAEQWIKDAWAGKLAKCKERMIKAEVDLSVKNSESIPAGDAAILQKHMARPEFKNRKQRESVR